MGAPAVSLLGAGAIFTALVLVLAALGALNGEVTGVTRSLRAIEAFGAAPPQLREEMEPSFRDRVIDPMQSRRSCSAAS